MYGRTAPELWLIGPGPLNPRQDPLGQKMLDYKKETLRRKEDISNIL
jgi:hypothetical protein